MVEDYSYPGAEKIFTDTAVRLIAGDGHMLFVDCDKPRSGDIGLLRIRSSSLPNDGHSGLGVGIDRDGRVCFEITGRTGYVTMTLPAVYEIRGNGYAPGAGHSVTAELTTDSGVRSVVDIQKDKATQVGTGSSSAETTLLKLVAKP
ncbi:MULTISPECIES: hypothetical protein [Actinosynnema]|uniref:hypothetical protein n=1 Tax=Actinosynnema TaxID=40566 RepID=UPI0020A33FB3|nr:hypothetical protein [Actinosynnema pretiosum]